jgi:hypothetical protein
MVGKPLRFQSAYEAARINDVTELDDEPNIIDDDYGNYLIVASYKAPELKAHCKRNSLDTTCSNAMLMSRVIAVLTK